MSVPQVVIVGRPNVGKSSVFNWLAGKRLSIVDDVAGVTRDRVTFLMQEDEHFFELVDTGGIGMNDVDNLTKEIDEQIELALESADVVQHRAETERRVQQMPARPARERAADDHLRSDARRCNVHDAHPDLAVIEQQRMARLDAVEDLRMGKEDPLVVALLLLRIEDIGLPGLELNAVARELSADAAIVTEPTGLE